MHLCHASSQEGAGWPVSTIALCTCRCVPRFGHPPPPSFLSCLSSSHVTHVICSIYTSDLTRVHVSRLNEIRQREQQRSRAGVSGSSAACLSSSAADPAPSSTASEAGRHAAAGPNTTPHAVPLPQTHASHHRPQEQQQFIFMREGDDLAVAATEEILGPGASWEGLLNSFSVSPGPLAAQPPGPSSPSVQGTGSTPSAAFDDAVFSLSNIPQHGSYSHSHGSAGNSRSLQAAPGAITSPPAPSSLNHLNGHGMWPSAVTDENLIRCTYWTKLSLRRVWSLINVL